MMDLAAMEAIAVDLSARVSALEAAAGGGDSIAVPNNFYITTFGTAQTPDMTWTQGWDLAAAYVPGETVRYNHATYVNLQPVPAHPIALGPLPATIADLKPQLRAYSPGEAIEDQILPSFPPYELRGQKLSPSVVYELHIKAKTKVKLYNPNWFYEPGEGAERKEPPFVHIAVWQNGEEGKEAAFESWGAEHETFEPVLAETTTKLWVVLFATEEAGGEGAYKPSLVPRSYTMRAEGAELIEGNKPPSEDREHWALVAREHAAGSSSINIAAPERVFPAVNEEHVVSVSKAARVDVIAHSKEETSCQIEVNANGVVLPQLMLPNSKGSATSTIGFFLDKGQKWKWVIAIGSVGGVEAVYQTIT
jgi:hypothetical protein